MDDSRDNRSQGPEILEIAGRRIARGERASLEIPVADLYTHTKLTMPVNVIRSEAPGPVMFISAAVHGDELNGVEIIRRLLRLRQLRRLRGTIIAVPIVNVHGFLRNSRYLPDRRDLNRSFPGSSNGSVAGRLAKVFIDEIVLNADYGIDLHTGAVHRANLPQIRADLSQATVRDMADAFGCPLLIDAPLREGSLREYADRKGVPLLLYEAGEALRFDEFSIRAGVRGVVGVMRHLGMLPARRQASTPAAPVVATDSSWERAPESGILRMLVDLGQHVEAGQVLGYVADPFGETEVAIQAEHAGIVIGRTYLPLAHAGDAIYHVARVKGAEALAARVEQFQEAHEPDDATDRGLSGEPPLV
ncbi:succinylglutamate desuccinylase/aspartoacylase family protein [Salinisphaera sp. Q1T1-3]|uniref:succinylglutamate desuccinylase/aspartoacylase family protein n=1 Tax=Salinisphaera sp. Q1T1-3 TaxID=2321229 RepID=UPI000E727717|nr:succinylglutamate desuccinylase/aspartoacylase family protein [Salinisphaera sp. Q1T1-3]RJS94811.1 succinylglutamate desuccinylase [Salinisphaera sp. Q1T1-3]